MTSFFDIVSDQQMAWVNEQQRGWQRMMSLPRVAQLATETKVGASAHDVVFETGTLRLLRYRRSTPATYAEPVLFCYALINRHYILDLQADKSVVQRYIDRGFDVYMIDWGVPADSDHGLTLRDYVEGLLKTVIDFILARHDRRDLHLLGYCMGGTLAVLFASLLPERVKSLTLMAAPIDFGRRETLLSLWTDPQYFDVDSLIDRYGNCPAPFLQSCFLLMKPVQNVIEKYVTFYEQLDDSRFVSNYFAMEHWVNDNIPVAGETFRTFVKSFFQKNELVRGEFLLGERRVDLARVSCPLLLLTAKSDHLVAPASTEGIVPFVSSTDIETMGIDAGHVGLVVGGKAHKAFWPKATAWLAERSSRPAGNEGEAGRFPTSLDGAGASAGGQGS